MQLRSDLVDSENLVVELYWRSLPDASNIEEKIGLVGGSKGDDGLLGVRSGVMPVLMSRAWMTEALGP